nr:spore protease YyaC [Paenibacillus guangzhouensis]
MMLEWDSSSPSSGARQKMSAERLSSFFQSIFAAHPVDQLSFVCIGTDRSTGDALGPFLGTLLEQRGFPHVIGTLANPCDATNLAERVKTIPPHHIVVAVDACLGHPSMVGQYYVSCSPLKPAESVGGGLPEVGHYSVAAVVNVSGPKPYWTLQMTSLYHVMQMAEKIASAVDEGRRSCTIARE